MRTGKSIATDLEITDMYVRIDAYMTKDEVFRALGIIVLGNPVYEKWNEHYVARPRHYAKLIKLSLENKKKKLLVVHPFSNRKTGIDPASLFFEKLC